MLVDLFMTCSVFLKFLKQRHGIPYTIIFMHHNHVLLLFFIVCELHLIKANNQKDKIYAV